MKTKHLFEARERSILSVMKQQPEHIEGIFICSGYGLTSLEGGPKSVSNTFWCNNNQLKTLEHAPTYVGRDFWCNENELETLQGAPTQVGGSFYCEKNNLESLEYAPQRVGGNFYCHGNPIESLHNVYKFVKKIDGAFVAPTNATHLLGLMWIEGVTEIRIQHNKPVSDIMNKYLKERDLHRRILLCQEELLDNGFEEQAQL